MPAEVTAVINNEGFDRQILAKVQSRTCRAVLEHMRDTLVVVFRKEFEDLVFKVAPIKTPWDKLETVSTADMSTVIPPQHAVYLKRNDHLTL